MDFLQQTDLKSIYLRHMQVVGKNTLDGSVPHFKLLGQISNGETSICIKRSLFPGVLFSA